ncbi:MAG: hypothetical protein NT075_18665 [Chloroflexi bacterium]|nr:hypothetical protein [Chloroflexota bacterium]
MSQPSERQMANLVEMLQHDPSLFARLPHWEADIVQRALDGQDVYEIAQALHIVEARVWEVLGSAAKMATGQPVQQIESGGLGSDTDPGVTGGYDETGFGRLPADAPLTDVEALNSSEGSPQDFDESDEIARDLDEEG